jgi:short subunit dehydrogenase-like uncharacterized protein
VPTIALLGASGHLGRLVAAELAARGHRFVAIGRDVEGVRTAVDRAAGHVDRYATADVTDRRSLAAVLADCDVALDASRPVDGPGRGVVETCITAGVHLVDLGFEQRHVRWVYDQASEAAWEAGVTLVPAGGFQAVVGDLLASVAAGAVGRPEQVHVAYDLGHGWIRSSPGTTRAVRSLLDQPGLVYEHGAIVTELPAETRRLAWFPRPVGPSHAAAVPGAEALTVPRHLPGIDTVRTYLAMSTWRAEALQALAGAVRWGPVGRRLTTALDRRAETPLDRVAARAQRWACVAEVVGPREVSRAWANGHDVAGVAATAAVLVLEAVLRGHVDVGAVPPSLVAVPSDLLDDLSARTGARWAVARPTPG